MQTTPTVSPVAVCEPDAVSAVAVSEVSAEAQAPEEPLSEAIEEPTPADPYATKLVQEKDFYREMVNVRARPAISDYWANTYVRPKLEAFGFHTPHAFLKKYLEEQYRRDDHQKSFLSVGPGNCELEVDIARCLLDKELGNFTIECFELNEAMLERGRALAEEKGVLDHLRFTQGDFNIWQAASEYDGVIADQSLHHVVNLEGLFDEIKKALKPDGVFLVSDMVGRNGHLRWPEALEIVHEFWRELPEHYKYNHSLKRHEDLYENWDCSRWGFEGIRSQDILPSLLERFQFELFIGFGNVIDIFVDRAFGHNFDRTNAWDRAFIDRVHLRDQAEIESGRIKPTHMLAVMSKRSGVPLKHHAPLTPRFCVRPPEETASGGTWAPPGHFYSPIVDPRNRHVRRIVASHSSSELPPSEALALDNGLILDNFYKISAFAREAPFKPAKEAGLRYYFNNQAFSFGDALAYFGMIRDRRPSRIIEVGSGYSSCLVMDTNDLFFTGSIEFEMIEPHADLLRSLLADGDPYLANLHETELQDVPTEFFRRLERNDILFIDSSHVCKTGSDVSDYLFRILPALQPGVLIHIHDIPYPFEYASNWIDVENRSWNEALVLRAFLEYNKAFQVIYFSHYMYRRHVDLLREALPLALQDSGASIWLQKTGAPG